MNTSETFQDFC